MKSFPTGRLLALLAGPLLAACAGTGSAAPAPTVAAADAGIHCPQGDHGLSQPQLGWSFCYPGTWKFRERVQKSDYPSGVDDTFDIVVGHAVIHHIPDLGACAQELRRVLRPGGPILIRSAFPGRLDGNSVWRARKKLVSIILNSAPHALTCLSAAGTSASCMKP